VLGAQREAQQAGVVQHGAEREVLVRGVGEGFG